MPVATSRPATYPGWISQAERRIVMSGKRKAATILDFFKKSRGALDSDGSKTGENDATSKEVCFIQASVGKDDESSSTVSTLNLEPASSSEPQPILADIATMKKVRSSNLSQGQILEKFQTIWMPERSYSFPLVTSGKKNRKFNFDWFEKYPWVVYSRCEDAAYCKYCVFHARREVGKSGQQSAGLLVSKGFRNWKDTHEYFRNHQDSGYHRESVACHLHIQRIHSGKEISIEKQLDIARQEQVVRNRKRLIPIVKTVLFCGRQGLSLRGHRDAGASLSEDGLANDGNFRALLRFRIDAGDHVLKEHLDTAKANATYLSWQTQNEILEASRRIILSKLVAQVNAAKCFTVLADETADVSSTEQFSVSVRYYNEDEGKIMEQFLQFVAVVDTSGHGLAKTLLSTLVELGIDLKYLRGQGYDGASAMSGAFSGVQAIVSRKYPLAVYVHCSSHSLNLAIGNATSVTSIRNCLGKIDKVYSFFTSPKRSALLEEEITKTTPESARHKLKQFSPTRWIERHDSVLVFVQLIDSVIKTLRVIATWKDRDTSSGAEMLACSLSNATFLIALYTVEKVFSYTVSLSKFLQSPDTDLLTAIQHVQTVWNEISYLRSNADEIFHDIYIQASEKACSLGSQPVVPRLVSNQVNRSNTPAENPEEYFRRTIFTPFCDHVLVELKNRFKKHENIIKSFVCLLPTGNEATMDDIDRFRTLTENYSVDLTATSQAELDSELRLWFARFKKPELSPSSPMTALSLADVRLFPNIHNLLKVFCTLPITTCTGERSFSTLRRLKTYLRSTMGQKRLTSIALLNIHREINVSPEDIIDELGKSKRRIDIAM